MVKGMLKRALSLFLTLFLVIGFLPAATVSAATETCLLYTSPSPRD